MSSLQNIPELSLSNYRDSNTAAEFSQQLFAGLKHYGFIILRDHGIPNTLLNEAYTLAKAFFDQAEDDKMAHIDKSVYYQRGYVPFGLERAKDSNYPDLKEMWHQGRCPSEEFPQAASYPKNLWPDHPPRFKEVFSELYAALDQTGQLVLEALTPELKVSAAYFRKLALGGNSLMRVLHYPPLAADVDKNCVRAAAHEDINLITLLVAASSSGLELLDRNGNWLPVNGSENSIIVDAGDMLARITNNVIPATTHRVVNPSGPNISRYSMPFFMHPKADSTLSCIESCQDGSQAPDIIADDFLNQRLEEIGVFGK